MTRRRTVVEAPVDPVAASAAEMFSKAKAHRHRSAVEVAPASAPASSGQPPQGARDEVEPSTSFAALIVDAVEHGEARGVGRWRRLDP